jgi:hypothetical protein
MKNAPGTVTVFEATEDHHPRGDTGHYRVLDINLAPKI